MGWDERGKKIARQIGLCFHSFCNFIFSFCTRIKVLYIYIYILFSGFGHAWKGHDCQKNPLVLYYMIQGIEKKRRENIEKGELHIEKSRTQRINF